MKSLLLPSLLLSLVIVTHSHAAPAPKLFTEGVRETEPLTPEQQQKTFHLPPGFKIQLVAAEPELRKPMNMAFDSAGRLWVTESREYPFGATNTAAARDTIRIFSDFDDNGRARKVTTFATNLNIPIGIYPFRSPASNTPKPNPQTPDAKPNPLTWKCLAWSIPNIWLFEDTDGDGVADKQEKLYGPFDVSRDTHGNQASFRRGLDGWIYATHGFNNQSRVAGTDGHEIFLPSGNIYRFRLDGSRIEHWTHGQVNPFGLTFDPLGNLYSADCHSSPIYQLLRGAHYPSFGRPHDGLGFGPTTIQHSHGSTAICGITHISDPSWPAEFQDNLFIGNVLTSRINRDQLEWRGSTSVGHEMPDFLSTDDPWFRPVDLQFGPDGALWVADFYNRIIGHYEVPLLHPGRDRERGRIWRIVPPAGADVRRLKVSADATASTAKLMDELMSTNPTRRSLALEELALQKDEETFATLETTAQAKLAAPSEAARASRVVSSLWLLQRAGRLWGFDREPILVEALLDPNPLVRCHVLRIVTDFAFKPAARLGDVITVPPIAWPLRQATVRALSDPNASVQRAAADALGANPTAQQFHVLLDLLNRTSPEDTHLVHNVRLAIQQHFRHESDFSQVIVDRLTATDAHALASIVVSLTNSRAAMFLLDHLQLHTEPPAILARYITHAARYAPDTELGTVATLAKKQFAADLDAQVALFKAMHDGLTVRGGALPPDLHAWGTALAGQLLAAAPKQATWSYVPLNPDKPGRNPFGFEERTSADGQKTHLMSSLPHGETLTGVLRSPVFVLPKQLSFYLCGHDGLPGQPAGKKNFVRLLEAETKTVLREAKVPRNDIAQKITWDVADVAGKRAVLEVTDGDDGKAYAWLAFGRFAPALPELVLGEVQSLARRQQTGADFARSLKLATLEPAVAKLFTETTDVATRAAAGRAWLVLNAPAALPRVEPLVRDAAQPETLRAELAAQLGESAEAQALAVVVAALTNAPTRLQTRFATALVSTAAGAEQLLAAAEAGRIPARLLQDRTLTDRLRASPAREASARLAALVKNLPAADVQLHKLIEAKRAGFDAKQASAVRGAEVFTKACAVCHLLEGKGALVGPQLDGIGGRGLERLLEDVLDPNRNVDKAFRTTVFVLKDGETVSGLARREEGGAFIYALANGQEARVPKADVKERRETETSLMPANFAEALTAAELNDLLAFLLSKSGK